MVESLPALWEAWGLTPELGKSLEKGMATHSSILAWRIHEQRNLASYSPQGH